MEAYTEVCLTLTLVKSGRGDLYAVGGLLLLVLVVFASTFTFQFVSDDHRQIQNAEVSAHPLTDALTRPVAENFYRPVFKLYLAFGRSVTGANPQGWHMLSVLMHALATLMAFIFCRIIGLTRPGALLAAAIMAVHPVHVESVAWISGVTDPLLAIFFLGSLIGFIRWRQGSRTRWLLLCLGSGALALLSKETAVMLAPAMLLLELTLLRGNLSELKRPSWLPFAATVLMTLVYLMVRMAVLRGFSHQWNEMTFAQMALTWPTVLVQYLRHIVWPFQLSFYYDIEPVTSIGSSTFIVPAAILGALIVIAAISLWRAHVRLLWFAAWWFPLLLAPVLYLRIYNHGDFAHDRYLYLPLLGVAIILAWFLEQLAQRLETRDVHWAGKVLAVGVVLGLAIASYMQSLYYRSDLLLFYRAVQLQPHSDVALNNLAIQLFERDMLAQALELYQRANERNPNSWMMQFNYALALEKAGRSEEADRSYRRAIFLNADAANVWIRWASMKAAHGRFDEAESILRAAISRLPAEADLRYAMGSVLEAEHRLPEAAQSYEHALTLRPGFPPAMERLRALGAEK